MNESTIEVKIFTPEGLYYDGVASSLLTPTTEGPVEIDPGHTNLITVIPPSGVMWIAKEGKKRYYAVFGGVLRVEEGKKATIFTEEINDGYSIDMARALSARDRSLDRIKAHTSDDDVRIARTKLNKALARISAKNLSEGKRE